MEQNLNTLSEVFGKNQEVMRQIAVINSTTPIKVDLEQEAEAEREENQLSKAYTKALLNRQFLNYPIILTTHVSLFDMMFGNTRENGGSFHQLANSVIVLDEIQSYRNDIWAEIIIFLKNFARLLNIKVIIMSATLPDLEVLSNDPDAAVRLVADREKYFSHPLFKDRVQVRYELMEQKLEVEGLLEIIQEKSHKGKKILVEFIKKDTAFQFYRALKDIAGINCQVELISGEDSIGERERILNLVRTTKNEGIILVATQVVEAGVDIDMDVGYKNYSKLDSEEQFMGRINRGCKNCGEVYFFEIDDPAGIYKNDVRMNKEFTIKQEDMQAVLAEKNFAAYYRDILAHLRSENESKSERGLEYFFREEVGSLNFTKVKEHMKLIEEDNWSMDVYLGRTISIGENKLDGNAVWQEYIQLLEDKKMKYPEKQIKLSIVRSKMNNFIYQGKEKQRFVLYR